MINKYYFMNDVVIRIKENKRKLSDNQMRVRRIKKKIKANRGKENE